MPDRGRRATGLLILNSATFPTSRRFEEMSVVCDFPCSTTTHVYNFSCPRTLLNSGTSNPETEGIVPYNLSGYLNAHRNVRARNPSNSTRIKSSSSIKGEEKKSYSRLNFFLLLSLIFFLRLLRNFFYCRQKLLFLKLFSL